MGGTILKRASKLFRAGKFSELIRLLEPQVFRYRENFQFYYYLGIACMYTGDNGGALSYLQRASQLNRDDVNTHLALAGLSLRRRDSAEAIRHYLNVLEIDSSNRRARIGLDTIRSADGEHDLFDFARSRRFRRLLPSTGFHVPGLIPIIAIGVVVFLFSFLYANEYLPFLSGSTRGQRPELEKITIEEGEDLVDRGGSYSIILTENEIESHFNSVKKSFNTSDYNVAQKSVNIINMSNASQSIKDKLTYLEGLFEVPDFTSLKTNFSFREVAADPELYNNCYVIWRGKISNLEMSDEVISFDLLVGYEDEKVLEGIVPVSLGFGADLDVEIPVEILGRVVVSGRKIFLEGISIHTILP